VLRFGEQDEPRAQWALKNRFELRLFFTGGSPRDDELGFGDQRRARGLGDAGELRHPMPGRFQPLAEFGLVHIYQQDLAHDSTASL
jgi:hypothetical protein